MRRKKENVRSRISKFSRLGYRDGLRTGFNKGYDQGFQDGWEAGRKQWETAFEGTSIIIPTYNQWKYLKECIESIQQYTKHPYEIIVVDNGSNDETQQYLQTMSFPIRPCILEHNLGFAGAVNQGLRLARGQTMVILNNDAVVTHRWLDNLLACVHSDPAIGIAGPVTNYISGDQLIEVDYANMEEMQKFARQHNVSNRHRWVDTERLTGFCMVMRRDVFERLGYLDEGFEVGNCEDDDYGLRTRLLGLRLVICQDTFIHHYGSISMRNLQSQFEVVYRHNLDYYSQKWEDPHLLLRMLKPLPSFPRRMTDFYPAHVAVTGNQHGLYWIENGRKYSLRSRPQLSGEPVLLSDIDLQHWSNGGELSQDEVEQKVAEWRSDQEHGVMDGMIVRTPEGVCYQLIGTTRRRIISDHTFRTWFQDRPVRSVHHDFLETFEEGLPILSPITLKANNL